MDGGIGTDTASYSDLLTTGVTVNLSTGTATSIDGGSDTLISIENVFGSNFNDSITGDSFNNTLTGLGGNDTLFGAAGNDILTGGSGADNFNFSGNVNNGNDVITDFQVGTDYFSFDVAPASDLSLSTIDTNNDGSLDSTLVDYGNGTVTLVGVTDVTVGDLHVL